MKTLLRRRGVVWLAVVLSGLFAEVSRAETSAVVGNPPAKSAPIEELSQAELLKSYLQLREQLQATQVAIATSRIEAEVAARTQAAAVAEKLDAIKNSLETTRERQRADAERLQTQLLESSRQQAELQRSNNTALWIATAFGAIVLLAMFVMPWLQFRAIHRIAEATVLRPALAGGNPPALPGGENVALPDQAVALANDRMQSVIERLEQRIYELEHTTDPVLPGTAAVRVSTQISSAGAETGTRALAGGDDLGLRIKQLLGKGRALLLAEKPREALSCFNEVLKLELNHPEALVQRGAALEKLKQDDEAIQCYDRAIRADARMTLAYLYKGGVCNRLERYEEAAACYQQALRSEEESRVSAVFDGQSNS
jgi:tetratricopeptide (TPR) repeat protein